MGHRQKNRHSTVICTVGTPTWRFFCQYPCNMYVPYAMRHARLQHGRRSSLLEKQSRSRITIDAKCQQQDNLRRSIFFGAGFIESSILNFQPQFGTWYLVCTLHFGIYYLRSIVLVMHSRFKTLISDTDTIALVLAYYVLRIRNSDARNRFLGRPSRISPSFASAISFDHIIYFT